MVFEYKKREWEENNAGRDEQNLERSAERWEGYNNGLEIRKQVGENKTGRDEQNHEEV